jgi:hypothetical protein
MSIRAPAQHAPAPASPERAFEPDQEAMLSEMLELAPKFLSNPSPEYMRATEIMPIVKVLARYA